MAPTLFVAGRITIPRLNGVLFEGANPVGVRAPSLMTLITPTSTNTETSYPFPMICVCTKSVQFFSSNFSQ